MVTLEYRVDPANADEFVAAMQVLGTIRRRDGAIQWGLFHDFSVGGLSKVLLLSLGRNTSDSLNG